MSLPDIPLPYTENFQPTLMATLNTWKAGIENSAAVDHTHGAASAVLSIVDSAATLGVGAAYGESKVTADTGHRWVWVSPGEWVEQDKTEVLPGTTIIWRTENVPDGYLECNGAAISRTAYAALFAAIGTRYGVGNGTTTFNIPLDLGEFFRVWAHGATTDPDKAARTDRGDGTTGDNIGTRQADEFKSHKHSITLGGYPVVGPDGYASGTTSAADTTRIANTGGNETRSRNVNIMSCIKY